mgnify:CR=1 FL=1
MITILLHYFGIIYAFTNMNCIIPILPYTIQKLPTNYQKMVYEVQKHFNKYSYFHNQRIDISDEYCTPCHSIELDPQDLSGYITLSGIYDGSSNNWVCDPANIYLSPSLTWDNTIFNIIMHEILHSKGLYHSRETDSVMNNTIIVDTQGIPIKDYPRFSLTWNDLYGLRNYII